MNCRAATARSPLGAAALVVLGALASPASALAYGKCTIDHPIVGTYPDAATPTVPRNAVFWLAVDGMVEPELILDGSYRWGPAYGVSGLERFRHAVSPLLTVGKHEATMSLSHDGSANPIEPDSVTVPFEVEDAFGPSPDEATRAQITRVTRYRPQSEHLVNLAYEDAVARVTAEPTDCSRQVAQQLQWCLTSPSPQAQLGNVHVELEVEGPVVGIVINDFFLPAWCRSAFFDEGTLQIRSVAATGLGTPQEYRGDVLEGPVETLAHIIAARGERGGSVECGFASAMPRVGRHPSLWAALLSGAFASRRIARRRVRAA